MRLKIGKAGQFLHLQRGTAFQVDAQSPAWFGDRDPNFLPTLKTYSFSVPNDAHNRIILRRPDLLDNPEEFLAEDGWQVYFDGFLLFAGRLEVEDTVASEDFRVTFIGGLAGNLNLLKETYLSQVDLGGARAIGATDNEVLAHATAVAADPDSFDYVFPTVRMAKESTYDDDGQPEQYLYANRYAGTSYARVVLVEDPPIYSALIPMAKLRYVIQQVLAHVGFTLRGVFSSSAYQEELNNLVLFNNVTLDTLATGSAPSEISFENLSLDTELDLSRHVPDILANDFLRSVCNTFAWAPFVDATGKSLLLKPYQDLLSGPYADDWTAKVDPRYVRARTIEGLPERFAYDHTSDDEYASLHELRLLGRPVGLEFATYADAVSSLTVDDGGVVYIESLNEYFDFRGLGSRGALLYSLGKSLGVINEYGTPTFTAPTDTLHMVTSTEEFGLAFPFNADDEFLPAFYGPYVSPWYDDAPLKDIILLFYRGLQPYGTFSLDYPLASSNAYSWGETKVGELSLLWTGEDGLYNRWWKTWVEALERMRPVTYATRLTASDLALLDFSKKYRIDRHEYLIKRVQVTITTDEILPAKIEYMQL